MDRSLSELIRISRLLGSNNRLTCGTSGNTSVKTLDGKFMFIKASGAALADMTAKRGWCKVNLKKVRQIINDKKIAKLSAKKRYVEICRRLSAACADKNRNNPSIETNLHAFLDRYVIHLHPIAVCVFLVSKNGKAELEKLFANEKPPVLWVPYAKPGYPLAKKIANLSNKYWRKYKHSPRILFLERHGLFISAPTAREALLLVRRVINKCERKIRTLQGRRINYTKIMSLCAIHDI